jgi:hypothetical protein
MNDISIGKTGEAPATREEIMSALFAHMVIQQTNMAMMLLGEVPHPQTGQHMLDLESARMFIDQLEMIEVKTKGNLDHEEEALLKQALAALRMSFVKAVDKAPPQETATPPLADAAAKTAPPVQPSTAEAKPAAPAAPEPPPAADDSKKKFSKKY